ncbi:MAG TPA: hydantoinase B/oxoprolinase family protein, partial [Geminicoccaceae bacterium]|nr:hydantoinase B/oxoprolinase family protein [Geminicoccaceae bacterium]
EGGNTGISIGGYDAERRPFIYVDFVCGSWGGRPFADGLEGNAHLFANMAAHSVEITEAEQPLQITAYEYLSDAAGPGKYRGGAPFRRDYRFLETEAVLQVRADRHAFRPYGLYGGQPGAPSQNTMNPGTERERELTAKVTTTIRRGDVFRHDSAGGGGWGDPLEREPWRVLKDWRDEFVGLEAARRDYGVVIDPAAKRVDEAATAELRERMRRERGWSEVPRVTADAPPAELGAAAE